MELVEIFERAAPRDDSLRLWRKSGDLCVPFC